jgi:lysyl-tRNA synthetase class 2
MRAAHELMPSTVIRSFKYDTDSRKLLIVFQSGRCYTYQNVPAETYTAMQNSFSKGEFFNAHIRDNFSFVRESAAT